MEWLSILIVLALARVGVVPAEDTLKALDAARAVAFEEGRPELLGAVYTDDSPLLGHDRALLASYQARGIDIERLRIAILDAEILTSSHQLMRLKVTDRLSESRVRLSNGTVRPLPRDRPTRQVITLEMTDHGWRISAVRPRSSTSDQDQ